MSSRNPSDDAPSERDLLIDSRDLEDQLLSEKSSSLWLGVYSRRHVLRAFRFYGILPHLESLGFEKVDLALEQLAPYRQALRLFDGEDRPENLLMELRAFEETLRPVKRLDDRFGPVMPQVMTIDWLTMQNPLAEFTADRPPFPGQEHPGLGMARPVTRMLIALARGRRLEAIVNHPNYYHNAWLYRDGFRFYDPENQARVKALHRDLRGLTAAEMAWAIELECVRSAETGQRFQWRSGLQLLPLSDRVRAYVESREHREQTERYLGKKRYELDQDRFRRLYPDRLARFRGRIRLPGAEENRRGAAGRKGVAMSDRSIYRMFKAVCEANPDAPAYRLKKGGEWRTVTWKEQLEACRKVSKSLIALGLNRGDRVCVLSNTRLEWTHADFGANACGFVTVGIYPSNLGEDCAYIIDHCGARAIFVENVEQLEKLMSVRDRTTGLDHYILFDGRSDPSRNVMGWEDFLSKGDAVSDERFEAAASAVAPDDLAALVYTSGTTGVPKGVMLTHDNLLFTADSVTGALPFKESYETLLFLPLAHVFARLIVYVCVRKALTVAFAEGIDKIGENLKEIRPHFIASVPRIFEKVYDKITTGAEEAGGIKEKLFRWAVGVGMEAGKYRLERKPVPGFLAFKRTLAEKLVFSKIHGAMGGRMQWAISGAAPLNKTIGEFFHACGILILEGLGMTENTSFSNVNRFDHYKFGTVGPTGPGIEMKLADDGEILFRGGNVMKGYYRNPEATAESIDSDGWLYTGDIGEIDEDGFLKITDRKKDLIITAGGKNIAPQRVEQTLKVSKYINQIVAYGDRRKYLTALITLETDNVANWAREQGIRFEDPGDLYKLPEVVKLLEDEVASCNSTLASFETVKKIRLLPGEFTIDSGELTPSLKVKRKVVLNKYLPLLNEMYEE